MGKKVKNMGRKQQKAVFASLKKARKKAWDYGDNPNIRHSHGEHKNKNKNESWE